ncbi:MULTISPECIES: dihydrofolate reductase family protein [unclassified Streptomyces]|uniref:dihydrofolate reductase family protein n=1 Tax=unclassified Streptomyces TaxID=2593676 RepID=UPI00380174A2
MRKLTYFVACSIDGFIGNPDGDASSMFAFLDEEFLGWLATEYPETVATPGRAGLGIQDAEHRHFDTVVQGLGSYRVGLDAGVTSPYAHLRQYVASRTLAASPDPDVEVIGDDLVARVRALKAEEGDLGVWLCGGAQIAGELLDEIDELVIKTYPQVYGAGLPMFGAGFAVTDFALDAVRAFDNGVLVRTYARRR